MARLSRILSTALITACVVILLDVGLTLTHREPLSSLYGSIQQSAARDELRELEAEFPAAADLRAAGRRAAGGAEGGGGPEGSVAEPRRAAELADRFAAGLEDGQAMGRLIAPAMGDLDTVFLQGIGTGTLQNGPGHYPMTSLPGQPGTVAVAGHRTTYGAPFREIASFESGDRIAIEMPYGRFSYAVTRTEVVAPDRIDVIEDVGYPQLVLSACHPLFSAAERYIVYARLAEVDSVP